MMFLAHLLFGFLTAQVACYLFKCDNPLLFVGVVLISSSLPDIDAAHSKISRKLYPISNITHFFFSHRGFIHSLLPAAVLFLLILKISTLVALAVLLGYLSHLALDSLTPKGIKPFYPINFKVSGFIKTNSITEKMVTILLLAITVVIILNQTAGS